MDLTKSDSAIVLPEIVGRQCQIHRVRNVEKLESSIRAAKPNLVCFDYDYPDSNGLEALTQTKRTFPALPILLISAYHSEALAVWALRTRVWDYIVKPYSIEDILRTLTLLSDVCQRQRRKPRKVIAPTNHVPGVPLCGRLTGKERAVLKSKIYIEAHLDEKLQQADLAKQYGMSHSHFSRAFRQVCGVGFSEFVLRARIEKALLMLADPHAQITTICYEVGFHDLSYFGRMFRRYIGMSPSEYQKVRKQRSSTGDWDKSSEDRFGRVPDSKDAGAVRQSTSLLQLKVFDQSQRGSSDFTAQHLKFIPRSVGYGS